MVRYTSEMNQTILTILSKNIGYAPDAHPRFDIEARYPARNLSSDALVTRVAPSPTGFVHIGTVYAAFVSERLAHQSQGTFFVRIEDTDKSREVAHADRMLLDGLQGFGLQIDASIDNPDGYGPYRQSEREEIYKAYVLDLLQSGRAYPCFATPEDLQANVAAQNAQKVRPGYYGKWALWREASDDQVLAKLSEGAPYILRFKSLGNHDEKATFTDAIKGDMSMAENDVDIPLLKSAGLPTYHLAHVVDDYLMKTTLVLRGDEWLPSTPLHFELCDALHIPRFTYAHIAPITIQDGGSKRKLSKRKDPQANVAFWHEEGYPADAVLSYLLGLADSGFSDAYAKDERIDPRNFPVSLSGLSKSRSPLLDMVKVADYAKNSLAQLSPAEFYDAYAMWAGTYSPVQSAALAAVDRTYAEAVFAIERSGDKPRKDVAKWSDVYEQYGFMFDDCFATDFSVRRTELLQSFSREVIQTLCQTFYAAYDKDATQLEFFENLKTAATRAGFCVDKNELKANPDRYVGGIADAAMIIRVQLTGKTKTPDLWSILKVLPTATLLARLA
jgi:glutamyl/glutaminyl-tRNA synthetase